MPIHHKRLSFLGLTALLAAFMVINQSPRVAAAAPRLLDASHPNVMAAAATAAAVSTPFQLTAGSSLPAFAQPVETASNQLVGREVFGFVNAGNLGNTSVGYPSWNMNLLSTVAYFGLNVNGTNGSLITNDTGWSVYHSTTMDSFVQKAHSHGVRVLASLDLHDFGTGVLNKTCEGLAAPSAQNTINQIVPQLSSAGATGTTHIDGINIDYEGTITTCANGQTNRDQLTAFTQNLRAAMPGGDYLAIDTFSGSAEDNQEFFNITGLAPYVDSFFVMAYDMDEANYSEAPLNCSSYCFNPISPLNTYRFNVTKSMDQYSALVPRSKIILGQPYYGRQGCVWNLGGPAHQAWIQGKQFGTPTYHYASIVPSESAVSNFASHRDPGDGVSRWDTWSDSYYGCSMEQYWDDVTSLSAKYDLVNQYNLRGVGLFSLDYAGGAPEVWSILATHFSQIPGAPGNVQACAGNASALVSWTPAPVNGPAITGYEVTADPGGFSVTVPATSHTATVTGLTAGTAYTFTVQALNSSGSGVGGGAPETVTPVANDPTTTLYFNWFDNASPGMVGDNIHVLNPGASTSSGCVTLSGLAVVPFSVDAGKEAYVTLPRGTLGGPVKVTVNTGPAVLSTQRVQYYSSFNEVWAMNAAHAATTSYLSWYDTASPGMVADNIHLLNPGGTTANLTVSLAGASPIKVALAPGTEQHVSFGQGHIGGPVTITSDQPVLASQRVQYYQSFNEVAARGTADATVSSYFNWFDLATPGMVGDNLHILNPGATTANVTVTLPGASPITRAIAPGAETYVSFGAHHIGGPVHIASDQPVLASQRVQYYQSFNEVSSEAPAQALATSYVMWFDRATPGMVGDNIHVLNPGATVANVTITLGTAQTTLTVAPGGEAYATFSPGHLGGPVIIVSDAAVLAAQRVQYYNSFNEVPASG